MRIWSLQMHEIPRNIYCCKLILCHNLSMHTHNDTRKKKKNGRREATSANGFVERSTTHGAAGYRRIGARGAILGGVSVQVLWVSMLWG